MPWYALPKTVAARAQQAANSRVASYFLIGALFWVVAAASHAGFFAKWGLRDKDPRFGIEGILDGTAHRPFVHRQLAPCLAALAERSLSETSKALIVEKLPIGRSFARATTASDPQYRVRYRIVYILSFLSLFGCLFILRRILLDLGASRLAAALAPSAFVLALPYLQTVGGYFYDSIELLFFALAFLFASRGRWGLLICLAPLATLNKEAFFFFVPALYPMLRRRLPVRLAALGAAATALASAAVNAATRSYYQGAPGTAVEVHILGNLAQYLHLATYRAVETTYGVPGPAGLFAGTLALLVLVALRGWPNCPREVRRHICVAAAINIPLFLFFCAAGELRNLSLTYIGLVILVASAMDRGEKVPN
jgi:hypothetical protein